MVRTEKFTIQFTGRGLLLSNARGQRLRFTPSEALLLLDILRHEEGCLREMARKSSPLPIKITFGGEPQKK